MKKVFMMMAIAAISLACSAQSNIRTKDLRTNVSKKEIHYKQDRDNYYLKVSHEGTDEYYRLAKKYELSIFNILQHSESCKDAYYNSIPEEARTINKNVDVYQNQASPNQDNDEISEGISSDRKIVVCKKPGIEITSHSDFSVGSNYILFQVKSSDNKALTGCDVVCKVIEIRKSNMSGSEGRLVLCPMYIIDKGKNNVELEHDYIHIRGRNRTNLKTWTSILILTNFIPGEGAKVKDTDEFVFTLK